MEAHAENWRRPRQPIDIIYRPFQRFAHQAASGGIVLLVFTIIALAWANSPWEQYYHEFWHSHMTLALAGAQLDFTLHEWINDGLMVIFFFVVGLEIKREVMTGELSSPRKAMLPIAAAFGGMIFPALIYTAFNHGTPEAVGWGTPMATDIAFAIGILALLGDRVPVALKVFLTALAIVDDLGAVLVIAIFYTSDLNLAALLGGFGFLAVMFIMNRAGVRSPLIYFIFAVGLWLCFLHSGVHATIAGVLAAMAIPGRTLIDEDTYLARTSFLVNACRRPDNEDELGGHYEKVRMLAQNLETVAEHVQPPLHRLERVLHPWTSFFIMPLFALANAGVTVGHELAKALESPVTLGIILGLVVGKQIGITLFSWGSVKAGWAALPRGVDWKQIYGVGWLGGIGFTMSLFIANLAFTDPDHLLMGKAGILCGSFLAGICGFVLLHRWIKD